MLFNIVFIFVDDFGWKDVSYNGFEYYDMLNIDWIVKKGFKFINGYVICQVCSFFWASIMMGKFLVWYGIIDYIGVWLDMIWRGVGCFIVFLLAKYDQVLNLVDMIFVEVL